MLLWQVFDVHISIERC